MNNVNKKTETVDNSESIDKYLKYPTIPYLGENPDILDQEVKVYEKLDGANCQFLNNNGKLVLGSRAKTAEEGLPPRLQGFRNWVFQNYEKFYDLNPRFIFFGEWLCTHSISYPERQKNQFYLIDLLDRKEGKFMDYEIAKEYIRERTSLDELEEFNLLHLLYEGVLDQEKIKELMRGSDFGIKKKEGLIFKNYNNAKFHQGEFKSFAKVVDEHFKRMRKEISLDDSRKIERIVKGYVSKDKVGSMKEKAQKEGYRLDSMDKDKIISKITQEILERIDFENRTSDLGYKDERKNGDLKEKIREDEIYRKRFEQALWVAVKEKL